MISRRIVWAALAAVLFFLPTWAAAAEKKVALFPFALNSTAPDGAAPLGEALLPDLAAELAQDKEVMIVGAERIAAAARGKRLSEAQILALGKEVGADFCLSGSLTEFGEQISLDGRIIDVSRGRLLPSVFVQGKGRRNMGAIVRQFKEDLIARLFSERRISRIEFKGNRRIEAGAIRQVLKSSAGDVYTEANLSADIKAIYKMGYFDDVTAEAVPGPEGTVLTFTVVEKPMIAEIRIRGNKALKREDIEAVMSVRTRQTLNPEKLKADVDKIKELYDGKGYYNARIDHEVVKEGPRDVAVVITVAEGEKLYIRRISFEGNRAFTAKELKNMMTTNEWGIFHFFTDSGVLKKEQLRQDIEKIKAFYLNNGFINAQIGEPEITHDEQGIYLKITVSEGKQFRVGAVAIIGDELAVPKQDLLAKLQIRKKEFFDREAIMKDVDYLIQACNDEGYANADVIPRTEPKEEGQVVDVTYQIAKGRLVHFNRINITGNTKTRDKVIRRELAVTEGDLYSRTKLKESYMALSRLRYFEEIDFQTQKGPDETLTDVNIRVKEKPTGIFSVGVGYSALEHALVSAQVSQQNLFGRGQTLSLKASLGSRTTLYDISFVEPWLFDMPLWSKWDLWNLYREYDTYNLDSKGFGFTLGYPLWPKITGYVGYKLSIDNVKDIKEGASYYIRKQEGETTMSGVTVSLTRDTTDDIIFPSRGSKNTVSVEYTGGPFLGDVSFTRYSATSSWFFPLPLDTTFAARGRIGYLHPNEGKEVPVYERYYLGGINSLRGLREVGPRDPVTGDVIGGLRMLNFNFEYLFPLIKNAGMKGLVFFDTGNTWEEGYHLGDMRKTAGFGIRWYSPIGPLRLEWGYVLDRKESESPSRWEFTIGMFM